MAACNLGAAPLLQDSCTGSDTLLGSVNVAGSIVILLLIGFVVGFALAWFIQWRKQRKRMLLEVRLPALPQQALDGSQRPIRGSPARKLGI